MFSDGLRGDQEFLLLALPVAFVLRLVFVFVPVFVLLALPVVPVFVVVELVPVVVPPVVSPRWCCGSWRWRCCCSRCRRRRSRPTATPAPAEPAGLNYVASIFLPSPSSGLFTKSLPAQSDTRSQTLAARPD